MIRQMHSPKSRVLAANDPREVPIYTVSEAAHYLRMPIPTLRSWVAGRKYPVKSGAHFFRPVILIPPGQKVLLSFVNLVEAHVLDAIRRQHDVPLVKVRKAIGYLRKAFNSRHPLADNRIETDGRELFVESLGRLVTISRDGQLAMREILEAHLKRIDWDQEGHAVRLYPFTRKRDIAEPRVVVIDPRRSFGRPVLVGTGIPTAIIAERYKAGETIDDLAQDYERNRLEIEEAIRCELFLEAA